MTTILPVKSNSSYCPSPPRAFSHVYFEFPFERANFNFSRIWRSI